MATNVGDAPPTDGGPADERALAERAADLRARVARAAERSGRLAEDVLIVAVTKTVAAERVRAAWALGFRVLGENRVQEARAKMEALAALGVRDARWEMIGHVQTNKAAIVAEHFARVQSADSLRLAAALDARAHAVGRVLPVLLEVNIGGEASKSGFAPEEVVGAAAQIVALPNLRAEGLMTVAPPAADPEAVRPAFRRLRALRDALRERYPMAGERDGGWRHLSMGMTDDMEVAIEEGATIVRIGRGLFGARPTLH